MDILQILKIICALATIATGLISLVAPRAIKGFTGLEATGPRGITAIGIMYLAIAAVRTVSMFLDRSVMQSNTISLIVEIVFGVILVL
jgi:hypothetical protein